MIYLSPLPAFPPIIRTLVSVTAVAWFSISVAVAGDVAPPVERHNPAGITGSLLLSGGGQLPAEARRQFFELARGAAAELVIIPTARDDADLQGKPDAGLQSWLSLNPKSAILLHTRSRNEADSDNFVSPLKSATGVWFDGGSQSRIADAYVGTAVERELTALLQRGGVIGGTSAGAAVQCRVMIAQGNPVAELKTGFDFLPGCIIDQHFTQRNRKPRLFGALEQHPHLFGLGIDEGTAVVVRGRDLQVIGSGAVTVCLNKSDARPAREVRFEDGEVTDLTRWRNAALARTQPAFPPQQAAAAKVAAGSLVIVGGGGLPPEIVDRFIQLAGGPTAKFVVLPVADPLSPTYPARQSQFLQKAGCQHVVVLPHRTLQEVSSAEFLDALKEASGIWFGGGRQWRFVDAYAGTPAERAFHEVLQRGGVIGGSSAGATIQGEYLVRGSPQGNQEMMAEGYERGLSFLPGCAIDQHFTQRKRLPDMLEVMHTFPQLLGIGLDEGTAIIVQGQTAEVLGKNQAHFFDARQATDQMLPASVSLEAGKRYDLVERKVKDE